MYYSGRKRPRSYSAKKRPSTKRARTAYVRAPVKRGSTKAKSKSSYLGYAKGLAGAAALGGAAYLGYRNRDLLSPAAGILARSANDLGGRARRTFQRRVLGQPVYDAEGDLVMDDGADSVGLDYLRGALDIASAPEMDSEMWNYPPEYKRAYPVLPVKTYTSGIADAAINTGNPYAAGLGLALKGGKYLYDRASRKHTSRLPN